MHGHLPKTLFQIQCSKNSWIGHANVDNALIYFFDTVFVNIRVKVKVSEILYNLKDISVLFRDTKMGKLYMDDDDLLTIPNFSQSSIVFAMLLMCASGILNYFWYTGLLSFKWILWKNFFALPKSVFETVIADLFLKSRSTYLALNYLGS